MAELKQYDPSKPLISVNLPTKEELIATTLGLIPGYRALKNMYDNPEGPISETLDLAAEDFIRLYGSLIKPAIKGEDINAEQVGKELAMAAVPVRLSSRARRNSTTNSRNSVDVPAGPYRETNTGSNLINEGQQLMNTNNVRTNGRSGKLIGGYEWQGDMYPPGRSLARLDEAGPYVWDAVPEQREYIRKLNDIINENENKWEYLLNKTRPVFIDGKPALQKTILSKDELASIALSQGRSDIAARVFNDVDNFGNPKLREYTQAGRSKRSDYNKRFGAYQSEQRPNQIPDNAKWKDYGNRQVEKELREQFAMLPEDDLMRQKFADYYGVPDLYNDWKANPEYWKEFTKYTKTRRGNREAIIKYYDKKFQRNIEK